MGNLGLSFSHGTKSESRSLGTCQLRCSEQAVCGAAKMKICAPGAGLRRATTGTAIGLFLLPKKRGRYPEDPVRPGDRAVTDARAPSVPSTYKCVLYYVLRSFAW